MFGLPRPALLLAGLLGAVAATASALIVAFPFNAAAFGGLTVPTVLASGVADGLNPCAFALLVLFATYTLTLVNAVTEDGSPTLLARQRLLGAGSLYVGAVWVTYFLIGLGLFSFLGWLGQDHLVTRVAVLLALVMALWMIKDILFPGWGPAMAAPHATHGWMHRAMERGGLAGMLIAGVLVDRFAGLVAGQAQQSVETVERIALISSLLPAGLQVASALLMLRYDLRRRPVSEPGVVAAPSTPALGADPLA